MLFFLCLNDVAAKVSWEQHVGTCESEPQSETVCTDWVKPPEEFSWLFYLNHSWIGQEWNYAFLKGINVKVNITEESEI